MSQEQFESDTRTYSQMKGDESIPHDVLNKRMIDELLTYTSQILIRRDLKDAAKAMLQIVKTELEWFYDYNEELGRIWLEFEPESAEIFKRHKKVIADVALEVSQRKEFDVAHIDFREALPEITVGWRQQIVEVLQGQRRTNQARVLREQGSRWIEDGLYFTNPGELHVYRKLKYLQEEKFSKEDTFSIFPLARCRIPGHTREPDFLITYKGRTGILEIDGPHHNARRSHDTSSEHLYRDAGISYIDRVSVEVLNDDNELEAVLRRFFRRLADTR
jgi:hypothetical protein